MTPSRFLTPAVAALWVLTAALVFAVDDAPQERREISPPRGGPPGAGKASQIRPPPQTPARRGFAGPPDGPSDGAPREPLDPAIEEGAGEADARVEARIRAIEEALRREIDAFEARLLAVKGRLLALIPAEARPGGPSSGPRAPEEGASPDRLARPLRGDDEDEKRYEVLVRRQEELVGRWRRLGAGPGTRDREGAEPRPGGDAKNGARDPDRGTERERLRAQLREVLAEQLEIRERSRERQVRRLRAELEEIERAMLRRQRPEERREMIERRLKDLLDGGAMVR